MFYSGIIPVFNRPEEVDELLKSLCSQSYTDFEVIVVEDGSSKRCDTVVQKYAGRLNIQYFYKENSGPGDTRNFGAEKSKGDYLIILDSDCIVPENYFAAIEKELNVSVCDAFGGPDKAHDSFTPTQKAINYAMTSFFTTGGIRGGEKKMDQFYPRSFNMGIRKTVYERLGGFSDMRFGEDIDFSIRIFKAGYSVRLFPEAFVYHKRRTDFKKFYRQVYNSGIARINLYKKYPESLKPVHLMPAAFASGTIFLLILSFICLYAFVPIGLFVVLVFADASIRNRSLIIGGLSVVASFIQLFGYGFGFLSAFWRRCVLNHPDVSAFDQTFYK
ncbi:MAG: glycosyltransferase [Candidatus Azobacteroides sp.]|nr:glycosyltransferase [Candidatus Azobacteroides sp.]